jgi:hypothetical protein
MTLVEVRGISKRRKKAVRPNHRAVLFAARSTAGTVPYDGDRGPVDRVASQRNSGTPMGDIDFEHLTMRVTRKIEERSTRPFGLAYVSAYVSLSAGCDRSTDRCSAEADATRPGGHDHGRVWQRVDGVKARGQQQGRSFTAQTLRRLAIVTAIEIEKAQSGPYIETDWFSAVPCSCGVVWG